ncbi:MAG TPA: FAD:protein FMN transferase [Candidatus Omnitrophota bacterium]|nr:FAD:protein FMN transferase [Candidatus Omnitrophota bacterium]
MLSIDRTPKSIFVITLILFAGGVSYYGHSFFSRQRIHYHQEQFLLGTVVRVNICGTRQNKQKVLDAFDRVWQRVQTINDRLSVYCAHSDITRINESYPKTVKVHSETAAVLRIAKDHCQRTDGVFDITVAPFLELWRTAQEKKQYPSQGLVSVISAAVGCDKVEILSGDYVRLTHPQTRIDLSGMGQGYAADEAARILQQQGFQDFLVDMGGEIVARGRNARGQPWRVGVKDPVDPYKLMSTVTISDKAVSTSGNYEKYFEIAGTNYSHIIDPRSGYPQQEIMSATVVTQNATQADIFSTVICALGREQGLKLLQRLDPSAGVLIVEKSAGENVKLYQNRSYKNLSAHP